MPMGPCPGPGRGGRHPVPAVVGADGAAGAGGRVFGCPSHRCPPTVSAAAPGEGGGRRVPGTPPGISLSLPLLPSRAQQHNRGPSFESISASGLNAALAHYRFGVGGWGMRSWRGSRVPATPPFSFPAHPTPPEGSCRWMRCTWRTPAGSTCAYPTPCPRPTLRPALQDLGLTSPLLQGWHHGHHTDRALGHADPAAEGAGTTGPSQPRSWGCGRRLDALRGGTGTSPLHHAQPPPRATFRKPTPAC